jgi:hypothetical protein
VNTKYVWGANTLLLRAPPEQQLLCTFPHPQNTTNDDETLRRCNHDKLIDFKMNDNVSRGTAKQASIR